jgi:hypothetical protein
VKDAKPEPIKAAPLPPAPEQATQGVYETLKAAEKSAEGKRPPGRPPLPEDVRRERERERDRLKKAGKRERDRYEREAPRLVKVTAGEIADQLDPATQTLDAAIQAAGKAPLDPKEGEALKSAVARVLFRIRATNFVTAFVVAATASAVAFRRATTTKSRIVILVGGVLLFVATHILLWKYGGDRDQAEPDAGAAAVPLVVEAPPAPAPAAEPKDKAAPDGG